MKNTDRMKVLQTAALPNGAGDAGGLWRGSSGKTSAITFFIVQPHRLEVLRAASNAFVAEELALGALGSNEVLGACKSACTRISVRLPAL